MINLKNEIGKKYGKLTIIEIIENYGVKSIVKCICDCGNTTQAKLNYIRYGQGTHCGCIRNKNAYKIKSNTRIYHIWHNMIARCNSKNRKDYKYYGGKGIQVCKEWGNFDNFVEWAYNNGYNDNLTIDRVDVTKNYCPNNCRWITNKEQSLNKSNTKYITYKGKTKSLKEWSEHLNIPYKKLQYRISQSNMSIEKAFTKP